MKERIDISQLQLGMFVAELDRPWLESPFLFQGFLVDDEEDLRTLKELCDYVYVDSERSVHIPAVARNGEAQAEHGSEIKVEPAVAPDRDANDPRHFANSFREVIGVQRRAQLRLIELIDRRRLGKRVDFGSIREVVEDLDRIIKEHPNAAMWLTKMREQDELTASHCMNVAILSMAFARYKRLPDEVIQGIGLGAMLHDIGLTGPANDIITSRARLSEEDFRIVRRHPVDGLFSLRNLDELSRVARDIIRSHHERLDGSGYPDGLAGEDIPVHVRIVGIADAYDAMASDRAYRAAMQPTQAMSELRRDASRSFGENLVQDFIRCIGVYPVGSVVRLNTGAVGMVASTLPGSRLTPLILLLKDSAGHNLTPRQLVNLEAINAHRPKHEDRWMIADTVDPIAYRINIASIAIDEMRAFR